MPLRIVNVSIRADSGGGATGGGSVGRLLPMAILNAIGEPKPYVQDVLSNNLAAGTFLASRDKSRLCLHAPNASS